MKKYLTPLIVLLLASLVVATNDGIKIGNGNEDADKNIGTGSSAGPIFQYGDAAESGKDVDSGLILVRSNGYTKTWRGALYQYDASSAWNRVDTCAPLEVEVDASNQWITFTFQIGHTLLNSDDSLYTFQVVSDGGSGEEYITETDSAGINYPILGGHSEKGLIYGNVGIGDAWPATLSGFSYFEVDTIPTFWVYYDVEAVTATNTYVQGPGAPQEVHSIVGGGAVHKK